MIKNTTKITSKQFLEIQFTFTSFILTFVILNFYFIFKKQFFSKLFKDYQID